MDVQIQTEFILIFLASLQFDRLFPLLEMRFKQLFLLYKNESGYNWLLILIRLLVMQKFHVYLSIEKYKKNLYSNLELFLYFYIFLSKTKYTSWNQWQVSVKPKV